MKAVTIQEHGGPEVVQVGEVQDPVPEDGEVLIEVRAAALNHLDIWVRGGAKAFSLDMPHVLGTDAAGEVIGLGPDVHGVEAGDEVVIYPGLPCGCCEHCVRGEHSQCESFGIVGATRPGTYAEKITVPAANVRPRPQNLSFAEAAALPVAYLTAWRMLMHRACLEPGETVLIHGIGGGVALAGLQICDLLGAEAIVTSSSHEKLQRAADMGAKHTINYLETEDVAEVVMDVTGGRGVDVALDSVGAQTWGINLRAVRRGGRVVICGVTTGPTAETDLQALYWNQISLLGSTLGSLDEFRQLLRTVETGDLKPLLDSIHSLEQAPQAMEKMEKGEQMGKIVLDLTA